MNYRITDACRKYACNGGSAVQRGERPSIREAVAMALAALSAKDDTVDYVTVAFMLNCVVPTFRNVDTVRRWQRLLVEGDARTGLPVFLEQVEN